MDIRDYYEPKMVLGVIEKTILCGHFSSTGFSTTQ